MKSPDRMFRVVVLGGIALTACGGAVTTGASSDAGTGSDAFPQEGPPFADAFPMETAQQVDAFFPTEGPDASISDTGSEAGYDAGVDSFPQEGPPPLPEASTSDGATDDATVEDGASEAGTILDGFPQEGPTRIDI
jgi:hypothetical protein